MFVQNRQGTSMPPSTSFGAGAGGGGAGAGAGAGGHVGAPAPLMFHNGAEIRYTARGQPYLWKGSDVVGDDDGKPTNHVSHAEVEEAVNEWVRTRLSPFSKLQEIRQEFGLGIAYYFDFLRFTHWVNLSVGVCSMIPYIVFLSKADEEHPGGRLDILYVSQYSSSMRALWTGLTVVGMIIALSFGPLYKRRLQRQSSTSSSENAQRFYEDEVLGTELDVIRENKYFTANARRWRIVGSYAIFLLILVAQGVLTWIVTAGLGQGNNLSSVVRSIVLSLTNLFFKFICVRLTMMERHLSWSSYRKHNTAKFLVFKLLNLSVLYLVQYGLGESGGASEVETDCFLTILARQFFWLLIIDVTLMNAIEYFWPQVKRWYRLNKTHQKGSDEQNRPDFDTSEEYLELMYRQFIIFMGMSVLPILPLMGIAANTIEYYFDKFRLTRVCRKPPRTRKPMQTFLSVCLFVTAMFSFLSFPSGTVYVLSNAYGGIGSTCSIFA